jgi:tetratricopeptide (TPR) repeat protein
MMKTQQFAEVLRLLHQAIEAAPSDWSNYYMAGQCARFLEDLDSAVIHLKQAVSLKPDDPAVLLAYGIALQLTKNFPEAVNTFRSAITSDPDYELAFNSLALTQEEQGDFASALETYESALQALARRLAKAMRNNRSNRIMKHDECQFHLWFEYATYGALYLCSRDPNVQGIAMPSASLALEEEQTERNGGLFWIDQLDTDNKQVRMFMPNYFNTFREALRTDRTYATILDNKGLLLEQQGRLEDAKQCLGEARHFLRPLYSYS